MQTDLQRLAKLSIVFHSIDIKCREDDSGEWIHSTDYPDRIQKYPEKIPRYKDCKLETVHKKNRNGTIIPTGPPYNLIGIDIDTKDDTPEMYQKLCDENKYDRNTFTMKTMHDGVHEYYTLSEEQASKLEKLCSMDGVIFGLHIDVKYKNQILFGPSNITADKTYTYRIAKNIPLIQLPEFIFDEIISHHKSDNQNNKKTTKKVDIKVDQKVVHAADKKPVDLIKEQQLKLYLDCLNDTRFDNYDDWIKIGFIIFNEDGSCSLWESYSKKSKKYDNTCSTKWKTFVPNPEKCANLTTLINMAQEDNIMQYRIASLRDRETIANTILKEGITDLSGARFFYCLCPNEYIKDIENNEWYKINKFGIYESDPDNTFLRGQMNTLLFEELDKCYKRKYDETTDLKVQQNLLINFKYAQRYLSTTRSKRNIIDELGVFYGQKKLFERLDNINHYVVGFNNGVFDLITNQFRDAKPEELITCTTKYSYAPPQQQYINEVTTILTNIFPDDLERKYVLKTISLGLIGDNPLEQFYIWIGSSRNGKGVLSTLIRNTLGEYYDTALIDYFCDSKHKSDSNSADSIMARKKNCRIVVSTEPEEDSRLKCSKLKQISGKDDVQVRELYKKPFNFVPKFKIIFQTNEKVLINGADGGIIERLRLITFPNKFVDEPKLKTDRLIDRNIKTKIDKVEYKLAFFQILVDHYHDFATNDKTRLDMPERMRKETEEMFQENDPFDAFIKEKIDITNDNKDVIYSSKLYESFIMFNSKNSKIATQITFKDKLVKKGFSCKRNQNGICFTGIKFRVTNEFAEE